MEVDLSRSRCCIPGHTVQVQMMGVDVIYISSSGAQVFTFAAAISYAYQ